MSKSDIRRKMEYKRDVAKRTGYLGAAEWWQEQIDGLPWVSEKAARALGEPSIRDIIRFPRETNPLKKHVHTKKWRDCVKQIKRKGAAVSPYAVCSAAIDEAGVLASHRRGNPVRDPEHRALIAKLRRHFSTDEAALRRMKRKKR